MALKLNGKVALITGGAGGLGHAICKQLATNGARVAVADLDLNKARGVAETIGASAMALHLDVASELSWQAAIGVVSAAWGKLDILVNNAGILKPATIEETTLEDWRNIMAINGDGVFLGCKFGVAAMKSMGGVIINLSSTLGLRGAAKHPAYGASKAAVRLLTQSVAKHCGEQGYKIRVIALLPGAVETDMLRQNIPTGVTEADYFAQIAAHYAVGRIGTPQDIAEAVVFLASDQASFITGTDFIVDGGGGL